MSYKLTFSLTNVTLGDLADFIEAAQKLDVIAANDFNNNASTQLVPIDQIPNGWQGLDAGEKSLEIFKKVILASKTILWNGPVGVFEMPNFAKGTIAVGEFCC